VTAPDILLRGVVGSHAYGLATEDSDVDRLGVFAWPTGHILRLRPPAESIITSSPDTALHEARKFVSLALKCNPTVTELLWLPDRLYEVITPLGEQLIGIRQSLLSSTYVRNAYLGYATQQFRRLENRSEHGDHSFSSDTKKRTAKHAWHLARLTEQGVLLYTEGKLDVRVTDPGFYHDFGEEVAAGDTGIAKLKIGQAETAMDTMGSVLPEHADETAAEAWLQAVRREYYKLPG